MSPTATIIALWIGFAGSHLALSSMGIRQRIVERIGEGPFRGLYSLVAFAFFIPLVWTYFAHKHAGPWLWVVPHNPVLVGIIDLGMVLAFVLVVASLVRPSPAAVIPGDPTPRGVFRITRHPLLMGLALFGLLHLVFNASSADVAFFAGFALFAPLGAWHQDRRKFAMDVPGFRQFYEGTPFLPFMGARALTGFRELGPLVAALGVGVAMIVRYYHTSWFSG